MKKYTLLSVILISTFSCNKSTSINEQANHKIEIYSTQLINDENFAFSLNNIVNNTKSIFKIVQKTCGKELLKSYMQLAKSNPSYNQLKKFYVSNNIDTTTMLQFHSENLASVLYILDKNPSFAEESPEIQSIVFSEIATTIDRRDFTITHKNSPIAAYSKNDLEIEDPVDDKPTIVMLDTELPPDLDEPISKGA